MQFMFLHVFEACMNSSMQQGPSGFRHAGSLDMDIPGSICPGELALREVDSNQLCEKKTFTGQVAVQLLFSYVGRES